MSDWYIEKGPESDVVVSSRVRLARNFKDYPFPYKMNNEQEEKVLEKVKEAVKNSNSTASEKFSFVDIQSLNPVDRQAMVERHIISPDLAASYRKSGAIVSKDEKVSIMVNEEDHLRIQCLFPGMQVNKAWELCNKVDSLLEEKIDFAFSKQYGYLTCCPTNIGTGLRASAMLHLPALTMIGYMPKILEACSKFGIVIRGLYGENSEASGNMFQVSNQITLGQTEDDIVASITSVASQIIEQERTIRSELHSNNPYRFEDKVYRSLGIFENARIMTAEESLKLISDVKLGVDMGIIKNISTEVINEIMLLIQPASLQKTANKTLNSHEIDIIRAEFIRKKLKSGENRKLTEDNL